MAGYAGIWLAVCVLTRHIERDILLLCRDMTSTNHSTENISRSNWIMSRCNFNQSHNFTTTWFGRIMLRPISNFTATYYLCCDWLKLSSVLLLTFDTLFFLGCHRVLYSWKVQCRHNYFMRSLILALPLYNKFNFSYVTANWYYQNQFKQKDYILILLQWGPRNLDSPGLQYLWQ